MGLHRRYAEILNDGHHTLNLSLSPDETDIEALRGAFAEMMRRLFQEKGSVLDVDIMASPEMQAFIETHAGIISGSFKQTEMTDGMRESLDASAYVFSGLKTFHELNEAFPSLIDENGNRKPFEQFLNDVQKVDETYNRNYLRAEYNFAHASAAMAARWEQFQADGDEYYLQYRTAGDDHVRPEHAALNGTTLPPSDPFWDAYMPPNAWNCRCTVVQVRKGKYALTPQKEAYARGEQALAKDKRGIFRFNAGKQRKAFPDYNPYSIKRCNDCDLAKGRASEGKGKLAWTLPNEADIQTEDKGTAKLAFVPDNELCAACRLVRQCYGDKTKSQRAIERTHYLHEMEPLLKVKHEKPVGEGTIKVGFSTYGNKHLFSDTFGRSKVLEKDDLASLDKVLRKATFIDSSLLTHTRKDNIQEFYYYKAELHRKKVRLNVAKEVRFRPNGKPRTTYYLYSINDINE